MKPATSFPPARESAGTNYSRPLRRTLCWTLAGFGLGAGAASAYLLLGGEYLWNIPRWAAFVFYPGFAAGVHANQWGLREQSSKVVGVLTVGLACAVVSVFVRLAWFAMKHRRQSASVRQISE